MLAGFSESQALEAEKYKKFSKGGPHPVHRLVVGSLFLDANPLPTDKFLKRPWPLLCPVWNNISQDFTCLN
jgi:hypothetical protein